MVVLTNCIGGEAKAIAKGIFGIFGYFQKNLVDEAPKHNFEHLEGRYANLWDVVNIVATGDKVVATYPDTWEPLTRAQSLEYVEENTFKMIDSDNFDSEGELVHFNLADGKVETINYAGMTLWPEAVWLEKHKSRQQIGE